MIQPSWRQFLTDSTSVLETQLEATAQTLEDEQAQLDNLIATGASESQINSQQAIVDATRGSYETLLAQLRTGASAAGTGRARLQRHRSRPRRPMRPVGRRWTFNLGRGLLAGLAAGVALSLVLEYVDPTLRGVRDLESVTRLPVLASIPFGIRWKYPPPPVSPDYRVLATKLRTVLQDTNHKSVLFTSTRPEEGNTTVATYAAMAMAQAGLRTLLLDANLNRPDLHKLFNVPMSPGPLQLHLAERRPARAADRRKRSTTSYRSRPVPRLSVLTAGKKMNDPSELLASAEMRAVPRRRRGQVGRRRDRWLGDVVRRRLRRDFARSSTALCSWRPRARPAATA